MNTPILTSALALAVLIPATAGVTPAVERYTANALNIGGDAGPAATLVQIDIDRWSTDDEHNRLVDPLATNKQSDAATVLRNLPRVGMIRALDLAGDPIYYARKTTAKDKSESILLLAIRPMRSFELAMKPNMSAFPFTVIEFNVDASGRGSGTITLAATLTGGREKAIGSVADRIVQPVRLTSVRKTSGVVLR
jgi:hypothetical protein